ncbi:hypothetical protein OIU78_022361 [Salix suchowensis]|nr:hypothetical protein OIU78_022361 [Salix suchowensis]
MTSCDSVQDRLPCRLYWIKSGELPSLIQNADQEPKPGKSHLLELPAKRKKTEPKAGEYKTDERKGSYQSWVAATDGGSTKKNTSRAPGFGGWDDLDKASYKAAGRRSQKGDERPKQNEGKLSRRRRVRDRPLLLRLLIAVFPFLDSWSKFLS